MQEISISNNNQFNPDIPFEFAPYQYGKSSGEVDFCLFEWIEEDNNLTYDHGEGGFYGPSFKDAGCVDGGGYRVICMSPQEKLYPEHRLVFLYHNSH